MEQPAPASCSSSFRSFLLKVEPTTPIGRALRPSFELRLAQKWQRFVTQFEAVEKFV